MPGPKSTMMRQDFSMVNAIAYGSARTHTTIQLALDAIGSLYRELILTDEDTGIWTLGGNITIPANVTLHVPPGVTIVGTGNLTIVGGLVAWRWPVYTGSGTFTWSGSTGNQAFNHLRTYDFTSTNLTCDVLTVTDHMSLGLSISVPTPSDEPPTEEIDFGAEIYNQASLGGAASRSGAIFATQQTALTADSTGASWNSGIKAKSILGLAGHHFIGTTRAGRFVAAVYGTGGVLDSLQGINIELQPMETSTTTAASGISVYGINPYTTGSVGSYVGVDILDQPASRVTGNIFALRGSISIQGAASRYNLYLDGTAPNYIKGYVGINVLPDSNYKLYVSGAAAKTTGTAWTDLSGQKWKNNIRQITGALDTLLRLQGSFFEWNEPERAQNMPGTQSGLIAENVAEVIPAWIDRDNEGNLLLTLRGEIAYVVEAFREVHNRLLALEGA